jgi:hypothetical protein
MWAEVVNRPLVIGATAGVVVGIAVTYLLPLLGPISRVFLWPSIPGVVVVLYLQGGGVVRGTAAPVVCINAMIYGLVGLLVGLVVGGIRRRRTVRRQRRGLYVKCGYNLTGNVSGVCPECGTQVKQP